MRPTTSPTDRRRRATARGAAASLGVLLLAALAGCEGGAEGAARAATPADRATPVEVLTVERHEFTQQIDVSANVMPLRQEALIPRVPGRLQKVLVEEGDRVETGQELARLDQRDYRLALRQAEANVAAARATAELASIGASAAATQRERMEKLRSSGAIAESELDKVADGQRMGEARQSAAEAQVQLAQVGLDAARTKVADTVLRAPFDGVVIQRMLDEGAMVGMSPETAAILVVADLSKVKVKGSVGERDVHSVSKGLVAKVHVDALAGETFEGTVEVVSPKVDPRSRTAAITVLVDNAEGRLEPGMAARIEVGLGEREVVAVPHEVLLRSTGGEAVADVFVVDGESRARRREVRLGSRHGSLVEVVEGLEPGERVVRSGQSGLDDGEQVILRSTE